MPVLRNPRHEAAAQALAALKSHEDAAAIGGLDKDATSFKSNARKFCNRKDIQARKREIMAQEAELAGITSGWMQLKIKRLLEFNVDDYLTPPNEHGVRYFDVSRASREQLERLSELTVEEFTEGRGAAATDVRRTKIKGHDQFAGMTLLARIRGFFAPEKMSPTNPDGTGPAVLEVVWKGTDQQTPQAA